MRDDLPRGRLTLLQSDIEGSTRLLHRLGAEGYARAQAEHRDVLRTAFATEGGVEVDTQGDSFFFVFPSADAAVRGAVAATRGLASLDWSHGDPVKVRVGLHTGEPQPTEEGYVGMVVNTSARICAIGHGGQILLSEETAAELATAGEETDVSLRDLGAHRLKDLDAPLKLFQVVIPELPSDFPPPRSAELRPNNLPVPLTQFIGRAELVTQLRDLLARPETRAVTLLGPGGTGKTRLGIRVGNELLHRMEDGAFFVALAPIHDPELVVSEIAGVFGVREEVGRPLLESLIDELAPKELLLILDNFEQVQPAARDVAVLLSRCPGVKILATSRQPLRVSGERGFPVPPLALPDAGQPLPDLATVAKFEAVRLFVERAQAARWDFELAADNVADVVEICRKVDALPLAIELATAKLYDMSLTTLLEALEHRLNVLTEGAVDLLDHQQTLRDLVAWSYDLLDDREKQLWRRLAVFAGGASMTAADEVCNLEGQFRFPGDVDNLAAKSLLSIQFGQGARSSGDQTDPEAVDHRVTMLETLREYAAEQLALSGERDQVAERHAQWFRRLAETANPELRGPRLDDWFERFDLEQANLRAAMTFGLEHAGQADVAGRIIGVLYFYFYQRGLLSEGNRWLAQAIARADDISPGVLARVYFGQANMERNLGHAEEARASCERALALFRSEGEEEGVADALSQLGAIYQHLGRFEEAREALSEGVDRLRALNSPGRLAFALVLLGALKQLDGDVASAIASYQESLELARKVGDKNYTATALVNLGEARVLQGDLAEAAESLRESLQLFLELGLRNLIAYVLELLGSIDGEEGRFREATLLFAAADRLREELDWPVESFNLDRYQRDLEKIRAGLGAEAYQAAWEEGRTMSLENVIDAAQHDLESVIDP